MMSAATTRNMLTIESHADWYDWRWQQKNCVKDLTGLSKYFDIQDSEIKSNIENHIKARKMHITPYYMQLIKKSLKDENLKDNALWRQVIPFWSEETTGSYDGSTENWELSHEMKTPICQHKYDNKVIFRMVNTGFVA